MLVKEMAYLDGTRVLVWRLEEETSQLFALCRGAGIDCEDLAKLPVKRLRERAGERLLLCHAFGRPVTLSHSDQGAPYIDCEKVNVSISHTMRMVVLALNEKHAIGIDAEQRDRVQVLKVRDKFLNDSEKHFVDLGNQDAHVMAWTAKEAIIKVNRDSSMDWTHGICLDPFTPDPVETVFTARCGDHCYRLTARSLDGHYITLAMPAVD